MNTSPFFRFVFSALIFCGFVSGLAAQGATPESILERVAPFLDKSTIVVGFVDFAKLDAEKAMAQLKETVDKSVAKTNLPPEGKQMLSATIDQMLASSEQSLRENKQVEELGCREIYVLVNSMTMAQNPARVIYVVDSSKADAVEKLKQEHAEKKTPILLQQQDDLLIMDMLIAGPSDEEREPVKKMILAMDKKRKAVPRPEFAEALERTRSAPIKIAFIPDAGIKGMLQFSFMSLPKEIQEIMTANTVLDAAKWISLGIDPNRLILDLNIKGESAEASQALYDAVIKVKDWSVDNSLAQAPPEAKDAMKAQMVEGEKMFMNFLPKVQEDRLRLTITPKFIDENLPALLESAAQGMMTAQESARKFHEQQHQMQQNKPRAKPSQN